MTEKIICPRPSGGEVFAVLYRPSAPSADGESAEKGKVPLVIRGHGFNGSWNDNPFYAERFAKSGIACCSLDFTGASVSSRSRGVSPDGYSVLTMAEDYRAVLDAVSGLDGIDAERIFLMGESQGGFTAAVTAPGVQTRIRGLILVYPALCIRDDGIRRYGEDIEKYPRRITLWGFTYGRKYYEDIIGMDVYGTIGAYTGPVLIVHGAADSVVPLRYSERAAEVYADCKLVTLAAAGHGFAGRDLADCADAMIEFVRR